MSSATTQPRDAVVVGVDVGPESERALLAGVEEALRLGRPLHLLHATGTGVVPWTVERLDRQRQVVERWREQAQARAPRLRVSAETHVDDAAAMLVRASRTASLVVVVASSLGRAASTLLGATTQKVVSHAACPVLVVPREGERSPTGPVVVGVDASDSCAPAVEWAFAVAAACGAPLQAVHTWWWEEPDPLFGGDEPGRDDEWGEEWADLAESQAMVVAEMLAGWRERYPDVAVTPIVLRGQAGPVLREYAEGARLLVVGTRGRGGFAGLLLGSVSSELVHTASCPVTVVPAPIPRAGGR
jgi:nucleotide-binding universal stress UspA family protein